MTYILIDKYVKVKWNSANKSRYTKLGYNFTKIGEAFDVRVKDLSRGSHAEIRVQCDYCGEISIRKWKTHIRNIEQSAIERDSCRDCQPQKSHEGFIKNHGITPGEMLQSKEIRDKSNKTIKEKYGVSNVFYLPWVIEKSQKTKDERYGRDYFSALMSGENNPMWNGGVTSKLKKLRGSYEYRDWRSAVLSKYNSVCQICESKDNIEVHHILGFAEHPKHRYSIDNGVTLCYSCHRKFHNTYGYKNFDDEDFENYIMNCKKV